MESAERVSAVKFEFRLAAGSGMMQVRAWLCAFPYAPYIELMHVPNATTALQLGRIALFERVAAPGRDAAGHELAQLPTAGAPPVASGWACTVCGGSFPGSAKRTGCTACRYELCASCRLLGRGGVRARPCGGGGGR